MRIDLPNGQWADLRERLTYGEAKPVRACYALIEKGGKAEAWADLDMELVTAYVTGWNVLDPDGNAVPLDAMESAPDDIVQTIAVAALKLWQKTNSLPKAGKRRSPSSLREVRSA